MYSIRGGTREVGLGYCFHLPHFPKIHYFHFKIENYCRHIKVWVFIISLFPHRRGQNWKEPSVVTMFDLKPLYLAPTTIKLSLPPGREHHTPQGHLWPPCCWIWHHQLDMTGCCLLLDSDTALSCCPAPSTSLFLSLQASLSLTLLLTARCWSAQGSVGEFLLSLFLRISLQAHDYK